MKALWICWIYGGDTSADDSNSTINCCINKIRSDFVESPIPQDPAKHSPDKRLQEKEYREKKLHIQWTT